MFENHKVFETKLAGRKLIVETGKIAQLANGACLIRYGDTVVNVAVAASPKPRDGIDFFPLSVDFEEKLYAVGKIPGSYLKREGRPSEKSILSSRVIDRSIRPLFPKDMRNDVAVTCTVLSVDEDCSPEITALIGASIALGISDIPWNGPISGLSMGFVDDKIVVNPNAKERLKSDLNLTVASTDEKVVMIEAGANEIADKIMYDAIIKAHDENHPMINFIKEIQAEVGIEKFSYENCELDQIFYEKLKNNIENDIKQALDTDDKNTRLKMVNSVLEKAKESYCGEFESECNRLEDYLYKLQKEVVRNWIINDSKRVDGRGLDGIRPLCAEVGFLPRTHGSGLFTRGQTQVLTVATLGSISEQQNLDGIDSEENKRYMHHYNFPSYSVGETRPNRGPGRREIGHGALAEKALLPVLPSTEEFPYAIRLVSEVVSSNGSTSQGAVCGSCLALMDAGVPIKSPVAGISCGLVTDGDRWETIVDIQGIEDFFGDMDFKVAGSAVGITAVQMDLKNDGLTPEIIKDALNKTQKARNFILNDVILKTIKEPRSELSKYAPKVLHTKIAIDKIREVIGSGGKVVQKITADFDVKIDIEDDGNLFVLGVDIEKCQKAMEYIKNLVMELEVGTTYKGRVTRITEFGAFIEIMPNKEGMCHISRLANKRIEKVSDVVKVEQEVFAKVIEIDDRGRINLSVKDAII